MLPLKKLNEKLNLSKREKILASIFLLLSLFFLYYQFVFTEQEKKIAAIKKDIQSKESMITQFNSLGYGNVSQLTARLQATDIEIDKLYEKVPNIKNLPGLLVDFYQSAKKNNVSAQTITFGKLEAKDNYSSFLVSLDVTGAKGDVFNFIKEIEGYPRLSKISKIEFEPKDGNMILAKISDEFFVLNDVKPDPLDYPFLSDKNNPGFPFSVFRQYNVTTAVDLSGNLTVRANSNVIPKSTEQQTSMAGNGSIGGTTQNNPGKNVVNNTGSSYSGIGNSSKNSDAKPSISGSRDSKGAENTNPYPWVRIK